MNTILTKYNNFFIFLFSLLFGFQLITLDSFRLPWYDEVFMVSMAKNYLETGLLSVDEIIYFSTSNKTELRPEILVYGKLYFQILSTIGNQFGFTMYTMRLPNFVAAFGVLLSCLWLLKYLNLSKIYFAFFLCLSILQEVFFRNISSGRMDFIATFFAMSALIIYLKSLQQTQLTYLYSFKIFVGVFVAAALLTTPRIVFMILPFSILFLHEIKENSRSFTPYLSNILIVIVAATVYYFYWLAPKFSNFEDFLMVYQNKETQNHIFAFARLLRFGLSYYVLLTPFLLTVFGGIFLVFKYVKFIYTPLLAYIIGCLFFYLLIVVEPQPYLAMVVPLLYVLVITVFAKLSEVSQNKWLKFGMNGVLTTLFIINFLAVSIRLITFVVSYHERNAEVVEQTFIKHLPKNSKVIADYEYYYCLLKQNCKFLPPYYWGEPIEIQKKQYNYDYLVLLKGNDSMLQSYAAHDKLVFVANFAEVDNQLVKIWKQYLAKLGAPSSISYEGVIYKRIKE